MNLNPLRDKAYRCATAHGWHEENHSNEHLLCLVITELMEAVNADRKGYYGDPAEFNQIIADIPSDATPAERDRWFKRAFEDHIKTAYPMSWPMPVSDYLIWPD